MSERRNLEYVTKTGRGTIHTRYVSDAYRDNWERTFGKKIPWRCPQCDESYLDPEDLGWHRVEKHESRQDGD